MYATCSLAAAENDGVADAFEAGGFGGWTGDGAGVRQVPAAGGEQHAAPVAGAFVRARLPGAARLGLEDRGGRVCVPPQALDSDGYFLAAWVRQR